jgi:hypothetical protein
MMAANASFRYNHFPGSTQVAREARPRGSEESRAVSEEIAG